MSDDGREVYHTVEDGRSKLPDVRLSEQGQPVGDVCRECGVELGAGYLCDECDSIEIDD